MSLCRAIIRIHFATSSHVLLTLILLTWRIWWTPNNASKWQMGFNSAFKGLKEILGLLSNILWSTYGTHCGMEWFQKERIATYSTNLSTTFSKTAKDLGQIAQSPAFKSSPWPMEYEAEAVYIWSWQDGSIICQERIRFSSRGSGAMVRCTTARLAKCKM